MTAKTQLVIPAAGIGARTGRPEPKALIPIADRPLLLRTLDAFAAAGLVEGAVILTPPEWEAEFSRVVTEAFGQAHITVSRGGEERQDSVRRGLELLDADTGVVAVHDAARPFVDTWAIQEAVAAAWEVGGATVATPCADTILIGDSAGTLIETPDREGLWACQTPQAFRLEPFREAHGKAWEENRRFTDDATLFKAYGGTVRIVAGSPRNRKITTEEDLLYAEYLIESASARKSG